MNSFYVYICLLALAAMFGGGLLGIWIAGRLPAHHVSKESGSVVKLASSVVATLTSLVLALMLSSANSAYSVNAGIVTKLSSDLIQLDRVLRAYGPGAGPVRADLLAYVRTKNDELFPARSARDVASDAASAAARPAASSQQSADLLDALMGSVIALSAADRSTERVADRRQAAIAAQAVTIVDRISAERWLLWENPGTTVPPQFLFVLIFWLFLVFLSFGLFAPANLTVMVSFFLSSIAVTGAIFLILNLGDHPTQSSWLQVSGEPLQRALVEIGRP
ncbi:MAG: hypothetical protein EPO67_17655 [Reyranella sp.]|nr:MAG: hypothetical protein EPO67_17655 [Reyranella sp.]